MLNTCKILATTNAEADQYATNAEAIGIHVTGTVIWTGPTPKGSYDYLTPWMRMSTPEFFYLRRANTDDMQTAIAIGDELTGYYRTSLTCHDLAEGVIEACKPRTTVTKLREYLDQIHDTPEGARALNVLDLIHEGRDAPRDA